MASVPLGNFDGPIRDPSNTPYRDRFTLVDCGIAIPPPREQGRNKGIEGYNDIFDQEGR
jgi:hypothetical protein